MKVPYIDLGLQHQQHKKEYLAAVERVLDSGWFILGPEVEKFENKVAEMAGTKYAVGVNSATDALLLVMLGAGIGPGDEVITAPNSFLASASTVALAGATPVFADVRDDFNIDPEEIKKAITSRTKAIIPVHLTGRPAAMDEILEIAKEHNLIVIEDCAQAIGATYKGGPIGSFGYAGCISLHPLKNLNACGDGGVIVTNDEILYEYLLKARNHGLKNRNECEFWSYNTRLDALQAAIMNVKIEHIAEVNERRREIAKIYQKELSGFVSVPVDQAYEEAVYHTFIIQVDRRDELQQYLLEKGIETKIHYPVPIHLQEAAAKYGYKLGDFPNTEEQVEKILSLPVFPELTDSQVYYVCEEIRRWCHGKR